ncbi:MAG: HPr kinase/phosphatase C-terminal domain-containing protein [Sphingomonadaceae bacterium]
MGLRQSGCIAIDGRAVLIEGKPGTGKSSLTLALIDRGAGFVGDDGVLLERRGERLVASPAPATKGLIELRNLGLVEVPSVAGQPVCLAITLSEDAPRFIEEAATIEIEGCAIPHLLLTPHDPVLPIKAELALARYGLARP